MYPEICSRWTVGLVEVFSKGSIPPGTREPGFHLPKGVRRGCGGYWHVKVHVASRLLQSILISTCHTFKVRPSLLALGSLQLPTLLTTQLPLPFSLPVHYSSALLSHGLHSPVPPQIAMAMSRLLLSLCFGFF